MGSIERELNEYLFLEFGMDDEGEDETLISETWPFSLRRLGEIGKILVFEFDEGDTPYFAIGEPYLSVFSKGGMTLDDLAQQFVGSDWIGAQDPVSLEESRPGDDTVPSGIERRRALEELGRHTTGDPHAEIMYGLFLRNGHRYLGLFSVPNESEAVIGGLDTPIRVGHDQCNSWRRLAWGVGQWVKSQREPATPTA